MSAPVTERPRGSVRTASRPGRTAPPPVVPAQRGAPRTRDAGAAQKAYARRDERLRRLVGGVRPARSGAPARRAQFVMLVMVLLGSGLVLTLWLSTAAAADSYRLQDARLAAAELSEQVEALRREVAVAGSAPELVRRAEQMGMVPVQDTARIVVAPDGTVTVVGDPSVARAPAPPPPPPVPVPPPAAGQAPAGESPADAAAPAGAAGEDPAAPVEPPAGEDPAAPAEPPAGDAAPVDPAAEEPVDPAEQAAADPAAAAAAAEPAADGATPAGN
ncbi:hypothetical protein [Pseudonocardia sp.]|uniref:hypothetical protein n=1 Tax=Pseudonocardia sp. TaxID=60912 RepID=UPI0026392FD7|nr:hypothetical protein [Pseudonocardia sp.]